MFTRWPIRNKLLLVVVILLTMIGALCASGVYGLYAYGNFVDSLCYVQEFRRATEIEQTAAALRVEAAGFRVPESSARILPNMSPVISFEQRESLRSRAAAVRAAVAEYNQYQEQALQNNAALFGGSMKEHNALWDVEASLGKIDAWLSESTFSTNASLLDSIQHESRLLHDYADQVPGMLQADMMAFVDSVRERYRTLIRVAWTALAAAAFGILFTVRLVSKSVIAPIRALANGSRRIAAGDYRHHVSVQGSEEFAELAKALNDMTDRFLLVRDDLDRQVRQRTAQIVRGERLAGVGFLAAGVSHEINNPLASIAMCAESLESRLRSAEDLNGLDKPQREIVTRYLTMIRSEAERCERIAEKLFDMSRIGDAERQPTDLHGLVREVVDVLRPLKQYHGRTIEIRKTGDATASVDAGEIKQVIMNLLTNALEHVRLDGRVWVSIAATSRFVELEFRDNGAGMSQHVLQHLFEPFFTSRQDSGGTGLGLSVAHRIVTAHGGDIAAESGGEGKGALFRVRLPRRSLLRDGGERSRQAA